MSDTPIARRIVVSGRVQGVAFRDATRREAEAHGVAGWVRNRADGTVEALLEGPSADVEAVLAFVRRGPRAARVDHVAVSEAVPRGDAGGGFVVASDA